MKRNLMRNFKWFTFCLGMTVLLLSSQAFADNERILFLHHSTGAGVYGGGDVPGWIEDYNRTSGANYIISERSYPNSPYPWSNYPYDYWNLWVNGACNSSQTGIECLSTLTQNYEVIIFKHCFPGAAIQADSGAPAANTADQELQNYRLQYRALRDVMDGYPHNIFIVWTLAPLHRLATNAGDAG
ncbi:MAG: hypothetical protein M0036_18005 [Desulfobacteraceae bacterium]|nr:hypothetical protein [Desulfobacteraceae bacterium]